jgi:hypothetical protein
MPKKPNYSYIFPWHRGICLARIFHESLAATLDLAVLPGVLACRLLRRPVQVRLETNPAVPRDGYPVARPSSWSRDSNS